MEELAILHRLGYGNFKKKLPEIQQEIKKHNSINNNIPIESYFVENEAHEDHAHVKSNKCKCKKGKCKLDVPKIHKLKCDDGLVALSSFRNKLIPDDPFGFGKENMTVHQEITLTEPLCVHNLHFADTGKIVTNGYQIKVSGKLTGNVNICANATVAGGNGFLVYVAARKWKINSGSFTANGSDGEDGVSGEDGQPGGNSGDFLFIFNRCKSKFSGKNLKLVFEGGDGGDGAKGIFENFNVVAQPGNGGKGGDGFTRGGDGGDGGCWLFENDGVIAITTSLTLTTGNGGDGGNGAVPGDGGDGGNIILKGTSIVYDLSGTDDFQLITGNGGSGNNGGNGGQIIVRDHESNQIIAGIGAGFNLPLNNLILTTGNGGNGVFGNGGDGGHIVASNLIANDSDSSSQSGFGGAIHGNLEVTTGNGGNSECGDAGDGGNISLDNLRSGDITSEGNINNRSTQAGIGGYIGSPTEPAPDTGLLKVKTGDGGESLKGSGGSGGYIRAFNLSSGNITVNVNGNNDINSSISQAGIGGNTINISVVTGSGNDGGNGGYIDMQNLFSGDLLTGAGGIQNSDTQAGIGGRAVGLLGDAIDRIFVLTGSGGNSCKNNAGNGGNIRLINVFSGNITANIVNGTLSQAGIGGATDNLNVLTGNGGNSCRKNAGNGGLLFLCGLTSGIITTSENEGSSNILSPSQAGIGGIVVGLLLVETGNGGISAIGLGGNGGDIILQKITSGLLIENGSSTAPPGTNTGSQAGIGGIVIILLSCITGSGGFSLSGNGGNGGLLKLNIITSGDVDVPGNSHFSQSGIGGAIAGTGDQVQNPELGNLLVRTGTGANSKYGYAGNGGSVILNTITSGNISGANNSISQAGIGGTMFFFELIQVLTGPGGNSKYSKGGDGGNLEFVNIISGSAMPPIIFGVGASSQAGIGAYFSFGGGGINIRTESGGDGRNGHGGDGGTAVFYNIMSGSIVVTAGSFSQAGVGLLELGEGSFDGINIATGPGGDAKGSNGGDGGDLVMELLKSSEENPGVGQAGVLISGAPNSNIDIITGNGGNATNKKNKCKSKEKFDGGDGGTICLGEDITLDIINADPIGEIIVTTGNGGDGADSKLFGGDGGDGGDVFAEPNSWTPNLGGGGKGGDGIFPGQNGEDGTFQNPPVSGCALEYLTDYPGHNQCSQ